MTEPASNAETSHGRERRSEAANAALVLGLISLALLVIFPAFVGGARRLPVVCAVATVAVGLVALLAAVWRPSEFSGKWRAAIGAVLGLFVVIVYGPLMSSFLYYQELPLCPANLRGLAAALTQYYRDHGALPPDLPTMTSLGYTSPRSYQCVLSENSHQQRAPDYGYVAGLSLADPHDWILVFDPPTNHERGDAFILYVSGEVKHLRAQKFEQEVYRFRREYEAARGQPPTIVNP